MLLKKQILLITCSLIYGLHYAQKTDNLQRKGIVAINVHPNIEKLVTTKFSESYGDNYKIQLFYGDLNKAHETLSKFNNNFPQWSGKILFETPNYKVWIGNFRTRLEADRALIEVRKKFSSAFIFKPKK